MHNSPADRDPTEMLADSFLARFRRGERPRVEYFAAEHPELGDEIRELLLALVMLEQEKPSAARADVAHGGALAQRGRPTASTSMIDATRILSDIEQGDAHAAGELLPLVYQELRKLAKVKLAQEKPGQTLQATDLVHEAYLRLAGAHRPQQWDSRGHFLPRRFRPCGASWSKTSAGSGVPSMADLDDGSISKGPTRSKRHPLRPT
jgi:hypothetical protein